MSHFTSDSIQDDNVEMSNISSLHHQSHDKSPMMTPNNEDEALSENDDADNDDDNNDDTPSILFSCRCESARPVFTLLSCLRNVSLSSNAGSGPSLSSLQAATTSIMTQSASAPYGASTTSTSSSRKVQYATVFVSDKSITFQCHGVGKQSRATVDMNAGLFSEYYVAEQRISIDDDDDDDDNGNQSQNNVEIIKGGEFGINLTTLLECLSVLGPNTLDRTTLCLSYDSNSAIFKIELLEQCYGPLASVGGSNLNSGTGSGVIISNCAIPGMAVADDDDSENGDGYLTLDHAFRSYPILARARIKSDFLKDAIAELTDVSGSTSATIGISKLGLELASYGHSTECHVVVPYLGNHPEIFVSLEGVMGGDNRGSSSSSNNSYIVHARNYPLHSILSAMRGLEIASETCITINKNGMVAIQHQVLDQVGNGVPNYVDFIMCCLEEDYDDEEDDEVEESKSGYRNGSTQQSNMSFIVPDDEQSKSQSQVQSRGLSYESDDENRRYSKRQNIDSKGVNYDDRETDDEMNVNTESMSPSQHSQQQSASLFGTVASIGAASEFLSSKSSSFHRDLRQRRNKQNQTTNDNESNDIESPRKRRGIGKSKTNYESTQSAAEESDFEEEEYSLDVTATVTSSSFRRRSAGGDEDEGDPTSSPQLMYGDTHLEGSGDEGAMFQTVNLTPSPVSAAFSGIQWDPLEKIGLTDTEKSLLRSGEDNPIEYTLSTHEDACMYVRALLKVLAESVGPNGNPSRKVSNIKEILPASDALQILYTDPTGVVTHYTIAKLYEVISCIREKKDNAEVTMINTFYDNGRLMDDWRPLLGILHLGGSGDPFAQRIASLCLAYILLPGCQSQVTNKQQNVIEYAPVKAALNALLSWISSQLQSSSGSNVSLVTPALTALMNCPDARFIFANSGGIGYISRHLRSKNQSSNNSPMKKPSGASAQQIYEMSFCIWAMTYDCNSSSTIRTTFARDNAVQSLCDLVSSAPREKIVRVALSALRNLAECKSHDTEKRSDKKIIDGSMFLGEMINCGLMKSIDLLKERQWSDPDIIDDVKVLSKLLHDNYKELSRWEVYENEVSSGNLEWGVLHSEKFFKENCRKLEGDDGNFDILKQLIILVSCEDEDVASIACYDIGEFVRYYPNGRHIAKRLGAKNAIMNLIEHDNIDLQRHALQAVSKMMVQNWTVSTMISTLK